MSSVWNPTGSALTPQITQALTGQFFQNLGATVNRMNDRLLIGAATVNDGNTPNVVSDWMTAAVAPNTSVCLAQLAVLSTIGAGAFIAATRASDATAAIANDEEICSAQSFLLNDGNGTLAVAHYIEAQQKVGAGYTNGLEIDAVNQSGVVVPMTPYTSFLGTPPALSLGMSIAAGGARAGVVNSTAALLITGNGAIFDKGIVFEASTIASNEAIAFGKSMSIQWWASATIPSGFMYSGAAANNWGIAISDDGVFLANSPNSSQSATGSIEAAGVTNSVNYMRVSGGITGSPVTVQATGSDTNVGLALVCKGTGVLQFGTTATTTVGAAGGGSALPATPVGYLQFVLASNGIEYRIPYYN